MKIREIMKRTMAIGLAVAMLLQSQSVVTLAETVQTDAAETVVVDVGEETSVSGNGNDELEEGEETLFISNNQEIDADMQSSRQDVSNAIVKYAQSLNGRYSTTYKKNGTAKAWTCYAFCNYVWKNLFGIDAWDGCHTTATGTNLNNLYSFLKNNDVKPGDILWVHSGTKNSGGNYTQTHNMVIMSYDQNGMYVTDGKSDGTIWGINRYVKYNDTNLVKYYDGNGGYKLYKIKNSAYNLQGGYAQPTDTTPPTITNIRVTDISKTGYTVSCEVTDDSGVDRVQFPSWTWYNDQDDIQSDWMHNPIASGTRNGNTYSYRVNISDHNNEYGWYFTAVYAYDIYGNERGASGANDGKVYVEAEPPVISDIQVTNKTEDGYRVSCVVKDNYEVAKVQFPTWTEKDGQDDLIWHDGIKNGDTYYYDVKISEHNNERDNYITHIYAWDSCGNQTSESGTYHYVGRTYVNIGSDLLVTIQNKKTGTVLTCGTDNNVAGYKYIGAQSQLWLMTLNQNGTYKISPCSNLSYCLDVHGGFDENGGNVSVYENNESVAQQWSLYGINGAYALFPACSDTKALDLENASDVEGTNVKIWEYAGGENSIFLINKESPVVSLDRTELQMNVGESCLLTANIYPNLKEMGVIWSSSNPDIVSVIDGFVRANSSGIATINATSKFDSTQSTSCTIVVKEGDGTNPTPSPVPTQTPVPTESPAPTQTPVPTESPAPTQTPAPTESPIPTPTTPASTSIYTYEVLADGTIRITSCQTSDVNLVIPDTIDGYTVTEIGANAFANQTSIQTVKFPANLKHIGVKAFANCTGLLEVTLPDTIQGAGQLCFSGCTALKKAVLNKGRINIVYGMFENCTSLTEVVIPDTVENVAMYAFLNCRSLTHLNLPASLKSISVHAFEGAGVTTITYAGTKAQWQKVKKNLTGNGSFVTATVTDSTGVLFTVSGSNNGNQNPQQTVKKPAKVKITKAKNVKTKKLTVKWKKTSKAKGYQIQIASNKKFTKGKKTKTLSKTTYSFKKLKKNKYYYVRVRAYVYNSNHKKVYGSWSAVKKVKIKK